MRSLARRLEGIGYREPLNIRGKAAPALKVVSVVGARPQFIKAAALDEALRGRHRHSVIHTGQHYDDLMSKIFFTDLGLQAPSRNLGVGSDRHGAQVGRMLILLEPALEEERPDIVLVYGDTNSTLGGALAASKLRIPLGHVEAGLRSYNRAMPEEVNRVVADHLADLLFAPTKTGVENLHREGIAEGVHRVGDVMLDILSRHVKEARDEEVPARLGVVPGHFLLLTIHRPSNADDPEHLAAILRALDDVGEDIVFPVHPRTASQMENQGLGENLGPRWRRIEPVGYREFISLLVSARKVVTDSGGVQKEAYFAGIPCITVRSETEWVETLEDGWNVLVAADPDSIRRAVAAAIPTQPRKDHYGDGHAAEKIVSILESWLEVS